MNNNIDGVVGEERDTPVILDVIYSEIEDYIYARNISRRKDININYRSLVEINKK